MPCADRSAAPFEQAAALSHLEGHDFRFIPDSCEVQDGSARRSDIAKSVAASRENSSKEISIGAEPGSSCHILAKSL